MICGPNKETNTKSHLSLLLRFIVSFTTKQTNKNKKREEEQKKENISALRTEFGQSKNRQ